MRTQRLEQPLTDEDRAADVLARRARVALTEDEATRFLDALETVDETTVARLAELRSRR